MGFQWLGSVWWRMLGVLLPYKMTPSNRTIKALFIVILCLSTCLGQVGQGAQRRKQKPRTRIPAEDKIPNAQIENWALSFGSVLWETARAATRFDAIQKKFHSEGAKTVQVDGFAMVKEMSMNVETMMQHKIDAIKRIMEYAENLALDHKYEKDLGTYLKKPPRMGGFHYFNAKKINVIDEDDEDQIDDWDKYLSATDRLEDDDRFRVGYSRVMLEENKHFSGIPVNTNMSSVHVPTNVFDGDPKVVNAIKWSRGLDRVFVDNYNRDPSLSWQYFGSSTGFMRQYPAMKWLTSDHDPDLYDARMRDWYIKSAASPKEIVILLDTSGSMTGLRREIAKHVVLNILDTLSEDDFVAIYKFSKYPTPLVDCFTTPDGRAELVQATNENIREYQEAVDQVQTEEIANFTSALTVAFELLHEARLDPDIGSNCNQAIMIVTDGVPYKYEEIFRLHNMPHKPVRMFTYLIGREISDLKAANHMACQNRGYFAHVTTLAEVKEQVLKYVPVMARPMVMYREDHPIQWTGVYADVEDPKTSRWLWDLRERSRQKSRTANYRKIMKMQQESADPLAKMDVEEDTAAAREAFEKLTRLPYKQQMENFLSYGRWDLTERDVERLKKDEEMKQRLIREITEAKTQKWTIPPKDLSMDMDTFQEMVAHNLDPAEYMTEMSRFAPKMAALRSSKKSDAKHQMIKNKMEESELRKNKFSGYRLMTSVSIPVFDKKNHTDPESLGLKKNPEGSFLRKNYTESVRVSDKKKVDVVKKVRIARLLGVSGTDVPIREIEKLTPPHKLGVNGYSFAVNNNGYILYHPDLRPMFQEILKPNYNSVDLAEVELVFDRLVDAQPRANDSELLALAFVGNRHYETKMRHDMVNQIKGQSFLTVKQHFDDMKRATVKTMDYFYHPLVNTPFSLGIALPQDYGKFRVEGKIEVPLAKFNVSSLFEDTNWRVHPDWIYCQYNYAGDHNREFISPEDTLKHFLIKMQEPNWSWGTPSVRPLPKCTNTEHFDPNCVKCERDLINSLVFDAVVTKDFEKQRSPHHGRGALSMRFDGYMNDMPAANNGSNETNEEIFTTTTKPIVLVKEPEYYSPRRPNMRRNNFYPDYYPQDEQNETYKRVGIQLAFIATRSGLMRFADHSHLFVDPKEDDRNKETPTLIKEPHFSDINNKATEETWYKRAVDYHKVDPKAFVYSIPFDVGEKRTKVTATHAIMVGRGSQKTPAAVAGMQIDYEIFRQMFFNETQKCVSGTRNCNKTCASEDLECYVVDNNGFVIISEDPVDTGKFFGEVDGTILESLIQHNIYRPIRIYDYQAICLEPEAEGGSASMLLTPFKLVAWLMNYMIGQVAWTIIRFEIHHMWNPDWTYAFPQGVGDEEFPLEYGYNDATYYDPNSNYPYDNQNDPLMDEFSIKDGGPIPLLQMTYINKTTPKPCDKQVILYELNDEKLYKPNKTTGKPVPVKGKLSNCHESDCERPFSVQLIPHTNLVLIVADKLCPCFSTKISIEPTKVEYGPVNETAYCERLKYNIHRRKPTHCYNYHPEETEIKLCGKGHVHTLSWVLATFAALLLLH